MFDPYAMPATACPHRSLRDGGLARWAIRAATAGALLLGGAFFAPSLSDGTPVAQGSPARAADARMDPMPRLPAMLQGQVRAVHGPRMIEISGVRIVLEALDCADATPEAAGTIAALMAENELREIVQGAQLNCTLGAARDDGIAQARCHLPDGRSLARLVAQKGSCRMRDI